MLDKVFTESGRNGIPSFDLLHQEEPVLFAFKTMEEIFDSSNGETDCPHKHNFYTILWAKNSCGKHFIDFRDYDFRPDIVFFVAPGQVHQVVTPVRPIGVVIMFTREFLCKYNIDEDFITNLGLFYGYPDEPPLEINKVGYERLSLYTDEIKLLFESQDKYRNESVASWIKLFLIECNRNLKENDETNTQLVQAGGSLVKSFKKELENKFSKWHKVSEYANALNVTADYLNNVMKNTVGQNAKVYIQQRLILEAKRLGVHTDLSSKEIAYALGFVDPAHFSKFYKNIEGSNFGDFRESLEKYNT